MYYDIHCYYNHQNQLHRIDGPAVEYADGTKEYWLNDKLHRSDGPAIEYYDGSKCWFWHGTLVTQQQHQHLSNVNQ